MDRHSPLSQHPGHDSSLSLSTPNAAEDSAPPSAVDIHDDSNEEYDEMDAFDDNDSAFFGSLVGHDTQTIASYITDYRYENGRRYHAYRDGSYWVIPPYCLSFFAPAKPDSSRDPTMSPQMKYKISHIICT